MNHGGEPNRLLSATRVQSGTWSPARLQALHEAGLPLVSARWRALWLVKGRRPCLSGPAGAQGRFTAS